MKKRTSSLLLTLLLALSLTACGGEYAGVSSTDIQYSEPGAFSELIDLPGPRSEPESGSSSEEDKSTPNENQNQAPDNQGKQDVSEGNSSSGKSSEGNRTVDENGWYTSKEEVALYIHLYGDLPDNYVTKSEAEDAGWSGGNVERYTGEGTAIGGARFGNREGLLPKEQGRTYTECDIDTVGESSRGAKRIVYSNDGLVYYTDDHYESFELLYGEP